MTQNNIIYLNNCSSILLNFLKLIDKSEWFLYIENFNSNISDYSNIEKNIIKELSQQQKKFINVNIIFSSNKMLNLDYQLQNKNLKLNMNMWNLCVFKNMFFNLPFTLQDIIFIPIDYINDSIAQSDNILINKKFSKTLIHEKIHLLQRYNQDIWDEYIISNTNWKINSFPKLNNTICLIKPNYIIFNPDTNYVEKNFYYKLNDKKYFGYMFINSHKKINSCWYQLINSNNKYILYPVNNFIVKWEHPYEELAYEISKKLVD